MGLVCTLTHTHTPIVAHESTYGAWKVSRPSTSHSQGHPCMPTMIHTPTGPTWVLVPEVSRWYRNPPALSSQSQVPCSEVNDENKCSSDLSGEALKDRPACKASFLSPHTAPATFLSILHAREQAGACPLMFYHQMSACISQAVLQFISIYCPQFSTCDLVLIGLYGFHI